jgi:hypothetical protein
VEYVQIVNIDSIDTWMVGIQKEKTLNMQSVIPKKEMFGLFGEAHEEANGAFTIRPEEDNKQLPFWKEAMNSGILNKADSDEED